MPRSVADNKVHTGLFKEEAHRKRAHVVLILVNLFGAACFINMANFPEKAQHWKGSFG